MLTQQRLRELSSKKIRRKRSQDSIRNFHSTLNGLIPPSKNKWPWEKSMSLIQNPGFYITKRSGTRLPQHPINNTRVKISLILLQRVFIKWCMSRSKHKMRKSWLQRMKNSSRVLLTPKRERRQRHNLSCIQKMREFEIQFAKTS